MDDLTHINSQGRARMVDVSGKDSTVRTAVAKGTVRVNADTYALVKSGGIRKGDVLSVAQVAGIQAAKRTFELIPMCHPVQTTGLDIAFTLEDDTASIIIEATARCKGETGVEMEALTAVSVAALTIYDMCKAVQRDIRIEDIHLTYKDGGKTGPWHGEA